MALAIFLSSFLFLFFFKDAALAVCPLCTIAMAGGLELSRFLGVDDSITGLWIGGLLASMSFWFSDWLGKRRRLRRGLRESLSFGIFYGLTIPFLFWSKIIGYSQTFFGIDKVFFGLIMGTLVFVGGVAADSYLRTKNNGRVIIYYQKVLLPSLFLAFASLLLFLLTLR